MLKTIHVNGVPYVCGRTKLEPNRFGSEFRFPWFFPPTQAFNDVDAIRAATKTLHPIYAAVENILGNDKYGDCTAAAAMKIQSIFDCAASGNDYRSPTLSDATWLYSQTTSPPFDPATGANDNGTSLQAVLSFWQMHGLYDDGHGKIKAAYAVDATSHIETNTTRGFRADVVPLTDPDKRFIREEVEKARTTKRLLLELDHLFALVDFAELNHHGSFECRRDAAHASAFLTLMSVLKVLRTARKSS